MTEKEKKGKKVCCTCGVFNHSEASASSAEQPSQRLPSIHLTLGDPFFIQCISVLSISSLTCVGCRTRLTVVSDETLATLATALSSLHVSASLLLLVEV